MRESVATGAARATTGGSTDRAATFGIYLLGQPRFIRSGELHKFSAPPRTLPLLAYLLLHRSAHLTRESIALALWANESEENARANLRRHLHYLKEALPSLGVPWFVADGETIRWQPNSRVLFDVERFDRCAAAGELEEAVALYAGDLLPSVYDDWIIAERDRLRALFVGALETLLSQARSRREFTPATDYARRILSDDPWREDTLRQLVSIRYESGDRSGALHEFETFARRLRSEMNAEPMPETIALRDIVLRGGSLPEHTAVREPERRDATTAVSLFPFVGRVVELKRLRAAWAGAAQGNGSFLLIAGEAGIGKSRLASELALLAASAGGRVLRGSTSPTEQMPYQALREVLRDAVPMFGSLDIRPIWLSAIGTLVPVVASRMNIPPPPPLDPQRERERLFEGLAQTFIALARQRPLLVILEDLHWAGASSVDALEFVTRRTSTQPILIVGTYRTEDVPVGHPLSALRRQLSGEDLVGHVALGGLSLGEIAELVAALPELCDRQDAFARRIAEASAGNPLFVGELIRHKAEARAQPELPPGISATILARAELLSMSGRLLAEIASVVGDNFDVELVRAVSGYDENAVLDGLSELLDRHMILESNTGQFEFRFAHHVIQEAIYYGVAEKRRARWHRRIAGMFEHLAEPARQNVLGALARHWDLAGDTARAAASYFSAAQRTSAVYAHEETVHHATRGLELVGDNDDLRFELLMAREASNRFLVDGDAQQRDLELLSHSVKFAADPQAQCHVLKRLAIFHHDRADWGAENEVIEHLAERAEVLNDDYWRASALECAATRNFGLGRYSDARAGFASAAAVKERLGDVAGQGVSMAEAARAAALSGTVDVAGQGVSMDDTLTQLARASETTRSSGDLRAMARVAVCAAVVAQIRRDLATWRLSANEALELTRSIGDRAGEASVHTGLGALAHQLWNVDEAREHFQKAAELFEGLMMPKYLCEALALAGGLAIELGLLDEAATLVERAAGFAEVSGVDRIRISCAQSAARIAALRGDFPLAIEASREALAKQVSARVAAEFLVIIASAELGLGRFDTSIEILEEALPVLRRYEISSAVLDGTIDIANAYLAAARSNDARRCVETLLREMAELHDAYPKLYRPRVLWLAGCVFSAISKAPRARELVREARTAFGKLRAAIPDKQTRDRFSALPQYREIATCA